VYHHASYSAKYWFPGCAGHLREEYAGFVTVLAPLLYKIHPLKQGKDGGEVVKKPWISEEGLHREQ
jgi:hypothetical protein